MGDPISQTIQELPIPEDVRKWHPSITRPSIISRPYDRRIPQEGIFYISSTQKYVVCLSCDLCQHQKQRCDRAWPTCTRCEKSGVTCNISNEGYQELPAPKRKRGAGEEVQSKNKTKRVKVAEATEGYDEESITIVRKRKGHLTGGSDRTRPRKWRSRRVTTKPLFDPRNADCRGPAKRKSSRTAPVKNKTKAIKSLIDSQKSKKGRRVVGAPYTVCVPEQKVNPFTIYVMPPDIDNICVRDAVTLKSDPKVSWASDKTELLAAIPSYPHIFEDKNIGHRGGVIDYLILEASSWPEDSWEGITICITRKWTQPKPSRSKLKRATRRKCLLLSRDVSSENQSPDIVQAHSTSVLLSASGSTKQPEIVGMQGIIDNTGETLPSFMNTLNSNDSSTSVLQTPFAEADFKSLPAEAECFHNSYTQKEPIRVIVGRDWSLCPFVLPQQYGYAALGLFMVAEVVFTTILDNNGQDETVVFRIKLEWVRNPCTPNNHISSTEPWWFSYFFRNDVMLKDVTINCKRNEEFSLVDFFPGIPYDETKNTSIIGNGQYDTSFYDFERNEWPSAWLCSNCGKVCPVIPFRYSVSWTCGFCKRVPQSKAKASFYHAVYDDPYDLCVPLPIQHKNITHTVFWGRDNDRYISYRFDECGIVLERVSREDQTYFRDISSLFEELQISVDFQPSDFHRRTLVYEADFSSAPPESVQHLRNIMHLCCQSRLNIQEAPPLPSMEVSCLRCVAWTSKGTTKNLVIKQGTHLFMSLGTTMTLKFNIYPDLGEVLPRNFEMPHGSLVFAMNIGSDLSYSVQHVGPSILVVAQLGM